MQFGTRRVLVRFQYDFVRVWKVTEFQYFGSKKILNILNGKALRNDKNSLGFQINNKIWSEISWISCWVLSLFGPLKFGWNVHFFIPRILPISILIERLGWISISDFLASINLKNKPQNTQMIESILHLFSF